MKSAPSFGIRLTITLSVVAIAIALVAYRYQVYLLNPWTRDGMVAADVIQLAPRINGPIVALPVKDNQQVSKGDLLFSIDPRTFQASLGQAEAKLKEVQAKYAEAKDRADRARRTHDADPGAESQQLMIQLEDAETLANASVEGAQADLDQANLNLEFADVTAPVHGYVSHLTLDLGTQAVANVPSLALIDLNSFWVSAFFRETQIAHIKPGSRAVIHLMAYPDQEIEGQVQSIGWGIAAPDGQPGFDLLPEVRPSFEWIRLAKRVPVRIELGKLPAGVELRVGITASVVILDDPD